MSILVASYIAFPLRPYFSNISKQLTKMPKMYFYDTGLLCFLLGIESPDQLSKSHLHGGVFENLAICELLKGQVNAAKDPRLYFYREKSGREVDALLESGRELSPYEIKWAGTLREEFLANMKAVAADLPFVTSLRLIYNGPSIPGIAVNVRDV